MCARQKNPSMSAKETFGIPVLVVARSSDLVATANLLPPKVISPQKSSNPPSKTFPISYNASEFRKAPKLPAKTKASID